MSGRMYCGGHGYTLPCPACAINLAKSAQPTPGPVDEYLADIAIGLNLSDSEDRAIFRMRVAERTEATTVEALREWALGSMRDRYTATRAVADAYIAKATGSAS